MSLFAIVLQVEFRGARRQLTQLAVDRVVAVHDQSQLAEADNTVVGVPTVTFVDAGLLHEGAQHREGANQVSQALNGHHAGNKHETSHVATTLSEDVGTRCLAGVIGFRHGLDEHTAGQDDCAVLLALIHLVDGRTNTVCLFQSLRVQVGCHIGAGVAEASHFQRTNQRQQEPDDAVLHKVQDDQQLCERNVENAQDEEVTECSRDPVEDEGERYGEKQYQQHGHEEEVELVGSERGHVLELRFGHACAYSTCFGALEPVLKDFSVNTQASAGARNLLVLHLDSTVKGQAGRLTELRNGNGRCQNHLD